MNEVKSDSDGSNFDFDSDDDDELLMTEGITPQKQLSGMINIISLLTVITITT